MKAGGGGWTIFSCGAKQSAEVFFIRQSTSTQKEDHRTQRIMGYNLSDVSSKQILTLYYQKPLHFGGGPLALKLVLKAEQSHRLHGGMRRMGKGRGVH